MPRPKIAIPQPLIHAASGRLYSRFTDDGGKRRQVYFGSASDPTAYEAYQRWADEVKKTGGRSKPSKAPPEPNGVYTIWELMDVFLKFASKRYRKRGELTSTALNIRRTCQLLVDSGEDVHTSIESFGPKRLRLFQEYVASQGLGPVTINLYISYIKRMFAWGAEQEIVAPEQVYRLRSVPSVKPGVPVGGSGVAPPRSKPRHAARVADIKAVFPVVTRGVRAMIRMQMLTGARPGEICGMRVGDVAVHPDDQACMIYTVQPDFDKVAHHEKAVPARVYLGPRASRLFKVLAKNRSPGDFLFLRLGRMQTTGGVPRSRGQNAQHRPFESPEVKRIATPCLRIGARSYVRAIRLAATDGHHTSCGTHAQAHSSKRLEL